MFGPDSEPPTVQKPNPDPTKTFGSATLILTGLILKTGSGSTTLILIGLILKIGYRSNQNIRIRNPDSKAYLVVVVVVVVYLVK